MTPVPQEPTEVMEDLNGDSIVVSGVSTLMPSCGNYLEFADKLYKKERLVKYDPSHWNNHKHPELSSYVGKLAEKISHFDAQFFMVHNTLAPILIDISKKLMEQSYRAVFDAGICPSALCGESVAVYIGVGHSENDKTVFFSTGKHGLVGSNKSMFANRISYFMNLTGPSVTVDSDNSSSFTALEQAQQAINSGVCDSAIVGSAKIMRHAPTAIAFHRHVPASPDGKMRCYDTEANGQFISQSVTVIYLQKYKDAKRVYARLHHVKSVFVMDEVFGEECKLYRSVGPLTKFFSEFYDEARISPSLVEYVDGFGAALPEFDKNELEAIAQVFCKNREYPLTVGSVASNVGYMEAASGLCGIVKLLIAYQRGEVAGNLDCDNPRRDVLAIQEGLMQIATENMPFRRTLAAVNTFSLSGVNGHALLQGHYKPKIPSQDTVDLPYLLLAAGRRETAVQKILEDFSSRPIDPEELGLLHNIFKSRISQYMSRGYGIYASKDGKTQVLRESKAYYDEKVRPLWFVYSGMGSQWNGMGLDLMRIPIFADAIYRCHKVLEPKGIDVIGIITSPDESTFDYILNSFVGIAAIQIGLTDVLKQVGLVPDNIIGHSVGELGCAYADGCITAEEMILMSYYRGLVSVETKFIRGAMAAIGIGYKNILRICPAEIDVACRNGPNSCTISGPEKVVSQFVQTLKSQGIFAKEVKSSNIAYHSRYIAEAGPSLLKYLKNVVKAPKLRTKRWISTSVPQNKWNEPDSLHSSAEYHSNNLLNPVLFEDMLRFIPSDAVLVEVAPYGLLQAILKRSLSPDCQHIVLTRRDDANTVNVLGGLGQLYMAGYDIDPSVLYPKVEFPVTTETRPLSHLVDFVHDQEWPIIMHNNLKRKHNAVYRQVITVQDDEYLYLAGHCIEGTCVYPFSAALISVWDTLAMTINSRRNEVSVVFKDIMMYIQPILEKDRPLHVVVTLQRGCGRFEVTCEQGVIAEGIIKAIAVPFTVSDVQIEYKQGLYELCDEDIYKLFYERGHEYSDQFRGISNTNMSVTNAELKWCGNWVTLFDAMFQMQALRRPKEGVSQVDCIKRIAVDFKKHLRNAFDCNGLLDATFDELGNTIKCGGVVMESVRFKTRPSLGMDSVSLKSLKFVPFIQQDDPNIISTMYVYIQIIAENLNKNQLTVYCIDSKTCALDNIKELLKTPPLIELDIIYISKNELFGPKKISTKPDLVFMDNLWNKATFEALFHTLPRNTYILTQGVDTEGLYPSSLYRTICSSAKGKSKIELARWRPAQIATTTTVVTVKSSSDLKNLHALRNNLTKNQKLLILSPYPAPVELLDLVKKWKHELDNISVAMIPDDCEDHDLKHLSNFDFVFNILHNNVWGGEYYVPTNSKCIETDNVALKITKPGDIDSLKWVQVPDVSNKGIPVKVHYAALNTTDVYRSQPENDKFEDGFGMDFSGLTERGHRVMGLLKSGAASKRVNADPRLLWPVPDEWSLEDAATVPLAYAHAFYCLMIRGKLKPGMNILIHGGAGALGQAAISIALANKCHVFTTVSDLKKKHFLRKLFPELKEENIGNSRDETFGDMIITCTNNEGCDIVLSCVRGALKNTTLKCVASNGVAIDTVHLSDPENFNYGLVHMFRCRSFMLADFSSIFRKENYEDVMKLQVLISEGIALGHVRPLSRVTYAPNEAPRALRLLAASRHRGRVLLNLQDLPPVEPRLICSPDLCQMIISEREDFAVQLADRLIARGAKKIHLHYMRPTFYQKYKNICWQNLGVQVKVTNFELNTRKLLENLLMESSLLGSIESVFVMKGGVPKYLSIDRSMLVNLDIASRKMCPNLSNFTVITNDKTERDVVENRIQAGLPVKLLVIEDIKQLGELDVTNQGNLAGGMGRWRLAFDAVERALLSEDSSVYAHKQPRARLSLMEEILKIPGMTLTRSTKDDMTLEQLGVDSKRAKDLSHLLQDKFRIAVPAEDIPLMTVAELKNLQKEEVDLKKDENGFGGIIDIIGEDEVTCTADITKMCTLIHPNGTRPEELDKDMDYLCVVPGIEAHHSRFELLCERLKMPAVVLQPGIDHPRENIEQLAERLVTIITKKLCIKDHYYLVGYEFGAMVVLEMAAILEKRGITSTVYLLGGTPGDIQNSLESRIASIGEEWENSLILHMTTLLTDKKCKSIDLQNALSWNEKVDACVKKIRPMVSFTSQYITRQLYAIYNRIKMVREWKLKIEPLSSKVIIMRAVLPTEISPNELKSLSTLAVKVFDLSAILIHAAKDLMSSAVINKNLSSEILEEYIKGNRCETSLVTEEILRLKYEDDDD